jgi:hypothetical protein
MSRFYNVGKVATKVTRSEDKITVRYHNTDVVTLDGIKREVTLNTGGYFSKTTKVRMNQASQEFCNGRFQVYQQNYDWFVMVNGQTLPFSGNKITFTL